MKRIYLACIACLLQAATLITPVWATDDAPTLTGIDQNLILHWDFEGETLEDQLADKAPAGTSKENLALVSTQDGETGEDLSYVADGVMHIDHNMANYAWSNYSNEAAGADIKGLATNGELTVFTAVKVIGSPQAWATFVDFENVSRMLVIGSAGNTADYSDFRIRGGTTAYTGPNIDWFPKNNGITHDVDVIYIAVTYEYDADTKVMIGTTFHSFDYGKTWTETAGAFEEIDEFLSLNTYICLGKTRKGNRYVRFDDGSSFDFYDFRVYNKALNLNEVKSIKTGHEPAGSDDQVPPVTTPSNPEGTEPTTPEATKPATPEVTKPATNEVTTPTTTPNAEKPDGGCASGIASGSAMVIALAGAAACLAKTKRKKK